MNHAGTSDSPSDRKASTKAKQSRVDLEPPPGLSWIAQATAAEVVGDLTFRILAHVAVDGFPKTPEEVKRYMEADVLTREMGDVEARALAKLALGIESEALKLVRRFVRVEKMAATSATDALLARDRRIEALVRANQSRHDPASDLIKEYLERHPDLGTKGILRKMLNDGVVQELSEDETEHGHGRLRFRSDPPQEIALSSFDSKVSRVRKSRRGLPPTADLED